MKIILTSREYSERLARERGIPIAPPDHPIYKEGPTFILLSDSPLSNEKGKVFKGVINDDQKKHTEF